MSELTKKWYVVRAQGGKEKKVEEYIRNEIKRLGKDDYVTDVVIPVEKVIQVKKNGKKETVDKIRFPGYVFVQACLTGEIQHIIRDIPFVSGFLTEIIKKDSKEKEPVPLRDSEVNQIQDKMDEMMDAEEDSAVQFVKGDPVKVADGPFNGFDGTIDEILEDKKKVKVMVKIFGRRTNLELNFSQVVKE